MMHDAELPTMSDETIGSSVYSRMPSQPAVPAADDQPQRRVAANERTIATSGISPTAKCQIRVACSFIW